MLAGLQSLLEIPGENLLAFSNFQTVLTFLSLWLSLSIFKSCSTASLIFSPLSDLPLATTGNGSGLLKPLRLDWTYLDNLRQCLYFRILKHIYKFPFILHYILLLNIHRLQGLGYGNHYAKFPSDKFIIAFQRLQCWASWKCPPKLICLGAQFFLWILALE